MIKAESTAKRMHHIRGAITAFRILVDMEDDRIQRPDPRGEKKMTQLRAHVQVLDDLADEIESSFRKKK